MLGFEEKSPKWSSIKAVPKIQIRTISAMKSMATAIPCVPHLAQSSSTFRISVVAMTGAAIVIDDATVADTMRSIKERVFAANYRLPVRRQRLMYRPGPRGIEPLADDETLGGAGVARDGTAVIDVLLADLTAAEQTELDQKLFQAAQIGRASDVLALISDGASVDAESNLGNTALMRAAFFGHFDCMRILLEGGADKEAVDRHGGTALFFAAAGGRSECVRFLLDAGSNLHHADQRDKTALMAAAEIANTDCVRVLLEAGADIHAADNVRG